MRPLQHEVPTHLNVEDRVLFGLTVRQFLLLLVGSSAAYALYGQLAVLPEAPRLVLVGLVVVAALVFALVRPAGRALEDWLVAGLVFAATPRRASWQAAEPRALDWRPIDARWHDLALDPVWAEPEPEPVLRPAS
jgi:hypothetical protein